MKTILLTAIAFAMTFAGLHANAADPLGQQLRSTGWNRLIGTWVDQASGGSNINVTFSWKLQDHVIENVTKSKDSESVALLGVNANQNETFHCAADNKGGSSQGTWTWTQDQAVLDLTGTSAEGTQLDLKITLKPVDDSTLEVFINEQTDTVMTLIRQDL